MNSTTSETQLADAQRALESATRAHADVQNDSSASEDAILFATSAVQRAEAVLRAREQAAKVVAAQVAEAARADTERRMHEAMADVEALDADIASELSRVDSLLPKVVSLQSALDSSTAKRNAAKRLSLQLASTLGAPPHACAKTGGACITESIPTDRCEACPFRQVPNAIAYLNSKVGAR